MNNSVEGLPMICQKQMKIVQSALESNNPWYGLYICMELAKSFPFCTELHKLLRACQTQCIPPALSKLGRYRRASETYFRGFFLFLKSYYYLKGNALMELMKSTIDILCENPYCLVGLSFQLRAARMKGNVDLEIFILESMIKIKKKVELQMELSELYMKVELLDLCEGVTQEILDEYPNYYPASDLQKKAIVKRMIQSSQSVFVNK